MKPADITGTKFGRLTVIARRGSDKKRQAIWECRCDCGNVVNVVGTYMRNGDTRSCGCLQKEVTSERSKIANKTHGRSDSPEFYSWKSMIQRCTNPNHDAFPRYGGMGITVCARWQGEGGFENFLADKGDRPDGTTLDRYPDNNGDYTPENTRWASAVEQANNRRRLAPPHSHCRKGHPLSVENVYIDRQGGRECRICRKLAMKRWVESKKVDQAS